MNLLQTDDLKWKHFTGSDKFNYPIDFYSSLLSVRSDGHVELYVVGTQQLLPLPPPYRQYHFVGAKGRTACD